MQSLNLVSVIGVLQDEDGGIDFVVSGSIVDDEPGYFFVDPVDILCGVSGIGWLEIDLVLPSSDKGEDDIEL